MSRAYYSDSLRGFRQTGTDEILGKLATANPFTLEQAQRDAWIEQIDILKRALDAYDGAIYFEFAVPRMGRRIDSVVVIRHVVFVLEFKIGEDAFPAHAQDQVWDYALDLKNFHETSSECVIAPVLIATRASTPEIEVAATIHNDGLLRPIKSSAGSLAEVVSAVLHAVEGDPIESGQWANGGYRPTPTIVEAATALYANHSVDEILRNDATAQNLSRTSDAITEIVLRSKRESLKSICFVTGVPGAGKTLVGLNIATKHIDKTNELYSVFLSGNGPLVAVLREALARNKVENARQRGVRVRKNEARSEVQMFIQNVHHFRDECRVDISKPPIEHVVLFDEAQRAWNLDQTVSFMRRKKGVKDFEQSEPEFLISCMDRHADWTVIVCLVGGGQEINTGEAGISEWIDSIARSFPDWHVFISARLTDSEYGAGAVLERLTSRRRVEYCDELHLAVSMRSFRAEHVSLLIKRILDLEAVDAKRTLDALRSKYPIVLTRDPAKAKHWIKQMARGSERYGIVVSSQAERLKPHAIDVKSPMDPIHWFLDGKDDVRSSYYLEDVATEFHVQGLELDWTAVVWDADFRYSQGIWDHKSFSGNRWMNIRAPERQIYLKNAYRVLLTRARQGMAIVVPEGDNEDATRLPEFYDETYRYLASIGFDTL